MSIDESERRHAAIWLAPWCNECERHCYSDGRTWCQEDVYEPCGECGRKSVKYVLAEESK